MRCSLYEAMCAHQLGLPLHLATHNGVLTSICDRLTACKASAELRADMHALAHHLGGISLEDAQFSYTADRAMILAKVHRCVGRPQLSICVQGMLAKAIQPALPFMGFKPALFLQSMKMLALVPSVAMSGRTGLHAAAQDSTAAIDTAIQALSGELHVVDARQLNVVDAKGATPLLLAARFNHPECVEHLGQLGASPSLEDCNGCSALHWAAIGGHGMVVEMLVRGMGVDPGSVDSHGCTAVHLAAMGGHGDVVEQLVGLGADPGARANNGYTAMHLAAVGGHGDVVEQLVSMGVDPRAKDYAGRPAAHLARQGGHSHVVEKLIWCKHRPS